MNPIALPAIIVLCSLSSLLAAPPETITLWPSGVPGGKGNIGEEKDTTTPTGDLVAGKRVIRLGNVTNPTLTIYKPAEDKNSGTAVIVCPGGGYRILAMDLEGTEVCEWFNSIGVTACLLKYRVPPGEGQERYAAPLQDAQRALGIVRQHAADWKIDPKRVGILGFSAGAHLSAAASTNYEKRNYDPLDDADQMSCRPDFALLIYPGYLALKDQGGKLPPELKVTANTPPTFLVQTEDDGVWVGNVLYYYIALQNAKVPAELHVYPKGGHGYGLRPSPNEVSHWPLRAEEWMRHLNLLSR